MVCSHFNDAFDLEPFLELDVGMMPQVLSLMTDEQRFKALYHTIRNWSLIVSLGFPSADRLRIRKLERENAAEEILALEIKRCKAEVILGKREKAALEKENELIKNCSLSPNLKKKETTGDLSSYVGILEIVSLQYNLLS